MSNKDLVLAAAKIRNVTRCRNTIGERASGHSFAAQPPLRRYRRYFAGGVCGLMYGCGDAVIGVNPATDSVEAVCAILKAIDRLITAFAIPTQACASRISPPSWRVDRGAPIDLLFQSVAARRQRTRASALISRCCGKAAALLDHHRTRDGGLGRRQRDVF